MHLLALAIAERQLDGVLDLVEGVRSVLIGVDETLLPLQKLADEVVAAWDTLQSLEDVELPVREVVLPIAFDDPLVHEAMIRYQTLGAAGRALVPGQRGVHPAGQRARRPATRCSRSSQQQAISWSGSGDVYLGAPVAVPLDPRHRLVTTKYDPARTWTPANAVGIGGIYLCVYGMEGPGGYQLLGRTVPVWRYDATRDEPPWLLRMFDRLRFKPVSADELAQAAG